MENNIIGLKEYLDGIVGGDDNKSYESDSELDSDYTDEVINIEDKESEDEDDDKCKIFINEIENDINKINIKIKKFQEINKKNGGVDLTPIITSIVNVIKGKPDVIIKKEKAEKATKEVESAISIAIDAELNTEQALIKFQQAEEEAIKAKDTKDEHIKTSKKLKSAEEELNKTRKKALDAKLKLEIKSRVALDAVNASTISTKAAADVAQERADNATDLKKAEADHALIKAQKALTEAEKVKVKVETITDQVESINEKIKNVDLIIQNKIEEVKEVKIEVEEVVEEEVKEVKENIDDLNELIINSHNVDDAEREDNINYENYLKEEDLKKKKKVGYNENYTFSYPSDQLRELVESL